MPTSTTGIDTDAKIRAGLATLDALVDPSAKDLVAKYLKLRLQILDPESDKFLTGSTES
jgi:hypothetical protein